MRKINFAGTKSTALVVVFAMTFIMGTAIFQSCSNPAAPNGSKGGALHPGGKDPGGNNREPATPAAPSIITTSLHAGAVDTEYTAALAAKGAMPITWTISDGSLPPGYTLDAETGVISGVTSIPGTHDFTVSAENIAGRTTANLSISTGDIVDVCITTSAMPDCAIGIQYDIQIETSGTGPVAWTAADLPSGLEIDPATGIISGVPSAADSGDYYVTITATGFSGVTHTQPFTMKVKNPVKIDKGLTVYGTANIALVTQTLSATGDGPYIWSGDLPQGLVISESGEITGRHANVGRYKAAVSVTNHEFSDEQEITVWIMPRIGRRWVSVLQFSTGFYESASIKHPIKAIAFGDNAFIAVGYNGTIARTASNGTSWTTYWPEAFAAGIVNTANPSDDSNYNIYAAGFGNNRFIAAGNMGIMTYSDNRGVDWHTVADTTFTSRIRAVDYGGDKWLAAGDGGRMAYSHNGTDWTAVEQSTFSGDIWDIAYGNGVYIAAGDGGRMARSTNGIDWTAIESGTGTWESQFIPLANAAGGPSMLIASITFANIDGVNRFVAVGDHGRIIYSDDGGLSWTLTSVTIGKSVTENLRGIAYGNGVFVAVGEDEYSAWSIDGITWGRIENTYGGSSLGMRQANAFGVAFGYGNFIIVGDSASIARSNATM